MASSLQHEQSAKMMRLRRVMTVVMYVGVTMTLLSTAAYFFDAESLFNVGILAMASALALAARWQIDRGRQTAAIVILALVMMVVIPAGLLESAGPARLMGLFMLLPVLGVAIVLPYSTDHLLLRLMIAAWVSSLTMAFYAYLVRYDGSFADGLAAYGLLFVELGAVDSLVFLMLWQFRKGLNGLVDELRESRRGLEQEMGQRTLALAQAQQLQTTEAEQRARLEQAAAELEQRIAAEQAAQAEAVRLRELELEGRRHLERVVDEYLGFAQRVAAGDLTQRLPADAEGALGELGQGLNAMVASLQRLTGEVQRASAALGDTAARLLVSATSQAANAAEQSAALGQTSATIEQVKAIALQTARQAEQLSAQSYEALGAAQQGTRAVEQTVEGMERIREHVVQIIESIGALAGRNQVIGGIAGTVGELADQSNLLALNAAIEAARAGEQGKSFSVVAQHVRELANRSKDAVVRISTILGEIQQATSAAVRASREGGTRVSDGASLAAAAGKVIQHMAAEVEAGAQANSQMAVAAQQQTEGMAQLDESMRQIEQATTLNLLSTREVEQAAQDLNALARQLQAVVAVYQV